ncbi:M23 family metallopeptidase [bacterium]|nr:M23 family metallopeptidase [Candidatus Omnitrophota bacterium]MBU2528679.1 M23 family metallopeptidase [bacterium]MBU3929430.1 M23 family metallopeptidase [bacterium]MBU4123151.1 M23 family metallopeptidase [bacterium]
MSDKTVKRYHVPRKQLTIMLLPHGGRRGTQVTISYLFLFLGCSVWFAITATAAYFISERVKIDETQKANITLQNKVVSFSEKLNNSLDLIAETSELNTRLKGILALGKESKIIEYSAAGGPSKLQSLQLSKILLETSPAESEELLAMNVEEMLAGGWQEKLNFREISEYLNEKRILARSTPAIWPAMGRVTSPFGLRASPFTGNSQFHSGLDIANVKDTPLRATADGRVVFAGWAGNLGKTVVISHRMGYTSYYGHCDEVFVKQQDKVERGQIIANIGSTGRATGYHVHYEIKRYGKALNPMYFVNRSF